ncbi:aminotransferase class III-fold pyridoxal phosphate-dependent enzyme [Azospirillum sp. TSO35-2]|uniref:aspartate aminotransferase family protein n=1 Tax=Azospirillum sp. TSO35-2 TaxID=716796 RepID=UPI000D60FE68|nr:aminotransferase class III-fold pyridoxal phosphate-dependent enzyme [Azospirillum sp. TSO35-2]PWC39806.1 4-aminobutyrate aminotransferase [Azospirillum sp. TSO35-2]
MTMINAYTPDSAASLPERERALIARRETLLGPAYRLFYTDPIHVVRGEGSYLYDADGNRYLDAYNNVASVGHSRPEVVEAMAKQAAVLNTHTRYLTDGILEFAEAFLAEFPPELSHLMMTCTGSEANDLALRVARVHTGGTGVVIAHNAYHGVTSALAELSPSLGSAVTLGDHVRVVPAPDSYRIPEAEVGAAFARSVEAAIADLREKGIKPAALLVDTIFSSSGVFTDPAGFLAPAVEVMRKAGGLFIADEVQPGFGRLGTHMWGFARHALVPDIVTVGKPMGNGHPVAGAVFRPAVIERFGKSQRYFNTFGGNPVSCAVALAVLRVIKADRLQENALTVGTELIQGLRGLAGKHDLIGDVRGSGLFVGVELVRDRADKSPASDETARVVNAMRKRRVLISATGQEGHILKIRPPLVFSSDDAKLFLATLDEVLAAL